MPPNLGTSGVVTSAAAPGADVFPPAEKRRKPTSTTRGSYPGRKTKRYQPAEGAMLGGAGAAALAGTEP